MLLFVLQCIIHDMGAQDAAELGMTRGLVGMVKFALFLLHMLKCLCNFTSSLNINTQFQNAYIRTKIS